MPELISLTSLPGADDDAPDSMWGRYETLVRTVALAANMTDQLDEAIEVTIAATCEAAGWPVGVGWRVASGRPLRLTPVVVHANDPDRHRPLLDLIEPMDKAAAGIAGAIAATGVSGAIRTVADGPNHLDQAARHCGLDIAVAFGIVADDQVQAVLEFYLPTRAAPTRPLLAAIDTTCRQLDRVAHRQSSSPSTRRVDRDGTDLPVIATQRVFLARVADRLQHDPARTVVARVDLDRFHVINERYGITRGDRILHAVADRLAAITGSPDDVARADDEFLLLFHDGGTTDPARLGWQILEAFDTPVDGPDDPIHLGVTVGIAVAGHLDRPTPHGLVDAATTALHEALSRGARRVGVHDPGRARTATRHADLALDLHAAIDHDEFEVHYQPKIDLATGRICGVEALIRWRHPDHGLVAPGQFIPEAERTGLIRPIGQLVLATACRHAATWQTLTTTPLDLAVNLSAAQLDDPHLPDRVYACLEDSRLPAARLVLEVTETALAQDTPTALDQLAHLQASGIRIAMDDFGSGYSSLERLQRFRFDQLKLDRTLLRHVTGLHDPIPLLRAAADIAHGLDMDLVAEGIETPQQLAAALRVGCTKAQGYLFAPALTPHDLHHLLTHPTWDPTPDTA